MFFISTEEDDWQWVDETPYEYNNWQDGEPNNLDDFRYCAKLYSWGTWDDTLCTEELGYICKAKKNIDYFQRLSCLTIIHSGGH